MDMEDLPYIFSLLVKIGLVPTTRCYENGTMQISEPVLYTYGSE